MTLSVIVMTPILVSLMAYGLRIKGYKAFLFAAQLVVLALSIQLFVTVEVRSSHLVIADLGDWSINGIRLVADEISTLFVVLTAFLFTLMLLYNFHKKYMDRQFLFIFMTFEGLIMTIFLSADLFDIYALVEVSTIVVSILIMYKKDSRSIYDGIIYLMTNLVAMTFFLIGTGYIYRTFGTLDILVIQNLMGEISDPRSLILPYALLMTGVGLKTAIMPLFSWLPKAHGSHGSPYIVSAILSGLYIKGNLYLFIRIQDTFGDILGTHRLFLIIGFITAIVGFIFSYLQEDIKLILAYSTVSQIGLMIFGFSIQTDYSQYGAIYHIISHALFKSTLFLGAGLIIDRYQTRKLRDIRGVFRTMPFVSLVMFTSVLAITGAPFFNGSVSKFLIEKGIYENQMLEYMLTFLNIGTFVYYMKFLSIFPGQGLERIRLPGNQVSAMAILGFACFITGVFGQYFVELFFDLKINFTPVDTWEKMLIYLASAIVGLAIYRIFEDQGWHKRDLASLEFTFNELMTAIVLYFAFLTAFLRLTV